MPKQYTFKTTRKTQWLEETLDSISSQDRSDFIREMIILGMSKSGMVESDALGSVKQTNARLVTDKGQTKVSHKSHNVTPLDLSELVLTVEEKPIDLDAALDNIKF